jgi:hypothetical protein
MGARSGGNSGGGFGSGSMNIIDNARQMKASDLVKMSEKGGLSGILATKELNSRVEIVKEPNLVFRRPDGKLTYSKKGFYAKVGDAGYVGGGSGVWSTSKKILKSVMDVGGFTKFTQANLYKPVGTVKNGYFTPY